MRRAFELDAARDDVPLAAGGTAFGLELVIFDGTTLDLFNCPKLAAEFGVPEGGKHPKLRLVALLQAGTMRWKKAAAIGAVQEGDHDGENALADQLEGALGPGQLSLADPLRLLLHGPLAPLLRRPRPSPVAGQERRPRPVLFRLLRTLKDGSELGPSAKAPTCWAGAARKQATGRCPGWRTPLPASSASPLDPHPPRQDEDRRDPRRRPRRRAAGADLVLSRQRRSRLFTPRDGRWKPLFCI